MRATEFIIETAMMGKIADSGKIIRILKKAHTVPFSDEKNWLLVDTDPGKGNSGLGIKWIPADTRFEWVRPYKDTVDENLSPQTIHKLADRKGVKWDNEPSFLQLTKRLTGKEHLDDLDHSGLNKVKRHLDGLQGVAEGIAETLQQQLAENLNVDVPNEEWLQNAIDYAIQKSPDRNGLPYMGKTTATARPVEVSVSILKRIPGMRREQSNVRHRDLAAIRKIMHTTGKLPLHTQTQEEYKPFINVAYDGSAWVNEGNHRIMAAAELGWPSLPVEISYFDGGERVESGAMYPGKIGLA